MRFIRDEWHWCAVASPGAIPKKLKRMRKIVAQFVRRIPVGLGTPAHRRRGTAPQHDRVNDGPGPRSGDAPTSDRRRYRVGFEARRRLRRRLEPPALRRSWPATRLRRADGRGLRDRRTAGLAAGASSVEHRLYSLFGSMLEEIPVDPDRTIKPGGIIDGVLLRYVPDGRREVVTALPSTALVWPGPMVGERTGVTVAKGPLGAGEAPPPRQHKSPHATWIGRVMWGHEGLVGQGAQLRFPFRTGWAGHASRLRLVQRRLHEPPTR